MKDISDTTIDNSSCNVNKRRNRRILKKISVNKVKKKVLKNEGIIEKVDIEIEGGIE